jgi:hypothetical protein
LRSRVGVAMAKTNVATFKVDEEIRKDKDQEKCGAS